MRRKRENYTATTPASIVQSPLMAAQPKIGKRRVVTSMASTGFRTPKCITTKETMNDSTQNRNHEHKTRTEIYTMYALCLALQYLIRPKCNAMQKKRKEKKRKKRKADPSTQFPPCTTHALVPYSTMNFECHAFAIESD
jgi:hypothetical protein